MYREIIGINIQTTNILNNIVEVILLIIISNEK